MNTTQPIPLNRIPAAICLVISLLLVGSATAQQAVSATKAVSTETRTIKAQKIKSPTLSKKLQQSLEKGDTRTAIKLCGKDCQGSSATTISSGSTGSPRDYTCNSGNCACAGAADCVAMAPVCQEGTMGCNDYGCSCKEDEGG